MNDNDQRSSERTLRVQTFGLDYATDFGAPGKAAGWFSDLDLVIRKIALARVGQRRTPVTKEEALLKLPEGVGNTAAITTLLAQAQELITRLGAAAHNKYSRAPDKLRAWQSASHIERAPRRAKKPAAAATPPEPTP